MKSRNLFLLIALVGAVAAGGCKASKSENPLAPSVAGPIPGVAITAPRLLTPSPGTQIEAASQPVTLLLENATTSGVRPLTYLFEVAMDADFNNKVLSREGISPGSNGQTSFRLPDPLAAERTYYWRARAQDGANTGPYASGVNFAIYTPTVLQPPLLGSPVNDTVVSDRNPTLALSNAGRSGPVVAIVYQIQVSKNEGFSQVVDDMQQVEGAGSTRKAVGVTLDYDTRYYWRARAIETSRNVQGPWSGIATFKTPPAPVVTPPPGGGGGGGGGGGKHVTGPLTAATAEQVVNATAAEFPGLTAVFSTDGEAESAAEELLLRTIWHLQLVGFQAGRQQNPSGAISKDKLTIVLDGSWHSYDIFSLGYAGHATRVQFMEVWPPNHIPSPGIPD